MPIAIAQMLRRNMRRLNVWSIITQIWSYEKKVDQRYGAGGPFATRVRFAVRGFRALWRLKRIFKTPNLHCRIASCRSPEDSSTSEHTSPADEDSTGDEISEYVMMLVQRQSLLRCSSIKNTPKAHRLSRLILWAIENVHAIVTHELHIHVINPTYFPLHILVQVVNSHLG